MTDSNRENNNDSSPKNSSSDYGLLLLWSTVVVIVGGYACGLSLAYLGALGSAAFLVLGTAAGRVASQWLGARGWTSACLLVIACLLALIVAWIVLIQSMTPPPGTGLITALKKLPRFIELNGELTAVAVVGAGFGSSLAAFQMRRR